MKVAASLIRTHEIWLPCINHCCLLWIFIPLWNILIHPSPVNCQSNARCHLKQALIPELISEKRKVSSRKENVCLVLLNKSLSANKYFSIFASAWVWLWIMPTVRKPFWNILADKSINIYPADASVNRTCGKNKTGQYDSVFSLAEKYLFASTRMERRRK